MVTPSLIRYVEQSLAAGKTKEQITSDLRLAGGWQPSDVEEAFAVLEQPPYKTPTKKKVSSFFNSLFIALLVIAILIFAAYKFDTPLVNSVFSNIAATFSSQPAQQVAPAPEVVAVAPVDTQTPEVAAIAPAPVTPPTLVNCNDNDTACLLQAAATCNPATEKNTTVTKTPKDTSTRFYAIIGQQNNQCVMSFSVKSDSAKSVVGKGALCTLSSATDLTTALTDWTKGDFTTDKALLTSQCTGSYFNN